MKESWIKEKAYMQRRASELATEMEAAIEARDRSRFEDAYYKSSRYMKKNERGRLYFKFLREKPSTWA